MLRTGCPPSKRPIRPPTRTTPVSGRSAPAAVCLLPRTPLFSSEPLLPACMACPARPSATTPGFRYCVRFSALR
ncbi:hypothetical protein CFIMG_003276RA [Ceratocystis fimbriata CBS 114723]|uniref:Uncharacterized protein n=1 Tax=Ceratocystis fimbriata CBS 114723 TaxID=1035309 RepID=A0A2C5WZV6_9PEZI|nr:hypothetical protein CFIMG_003276RA [Ceratocystis fimbriata CBS 114723]